MIDCSFAKMPGKLLWNSTWKSTVGQSIPVKELSPTKAESSFKTFAWKFEDIPQERLAGIVDLLK